MKANAVPVYVGWALTSGRLDTLHTGMDGSIRWKDLSIWMSQRSNIYLGMAGVSGHPILYANGRGGVRGGEGNPARPGPLSRNVKAVDIQIWQQSSFSVNTKQFGGKILLVC